MANLIRVGSQLADALRMVQKYVKYATGKQATDTEIANTLKSYFIINEIGNQIKFQRKKSPSNAEQRQHKQKDPLWTMNLIGGSTKISFAKAGLFSECVQEAIQTTADFVKNATGEEASPKEIAESLKSSFILSEIKNQIDWQRKNPGKTAESNHTP